MKLKYLFLLIVGLLFCTAVATADEQKVNVNMKIITYEIENVNVVGDSFYYKINFTNIGNWTVSDNITISVFNPSRNLLAPPETYEIVLKPSDSKAVIAKGGKENETAIFPFDTSGDYKIEINSTMGIDFYRWLVINKGNRIYTSYIRQNKNFNYFFDVMPRWQYNISESTEEANRKVIEANQKLLDLTININNATQSMKTATWVMLGVAIISLIIAFLKRYD